MTSQPERDHPVPSDEEGTGVVDEAVPEQTEVVEALEEGAGVEATNGEILTDVAALAAERDEYLSALQRTQADFANYRKRVLRQQEEQAGRAATDLVIKILPVLDTLDLAVAHLGAVEGDGPAPAEGTALRQARGQLIDTLCKEGLERVDSVGVPFDPSVHDAVAHAPRSEDDDDEDGSTIDEVMRAGYRWRGQIVRPAMVRVRG
jgi:molecular chaperone GrpE